MAQTPLASKLIPSPLPTDRIEEIIRSFSVKESGIVESLAQCGFKRDVTIQTIGATGQVTGEYRRVSTFQSDGKGKRMEKTLLSPDSTVTALTISDEDLNDLTWSGLLSSPKPDAYSFHYLGKEKIYELDLYVFEVAPKITAGPVGAGERMFQGRIWVDDQDLVIVKTRGKLIPEGLESRYPVLETYRENTDGRHWFPTYIYGDDTMTFTDGSVVRLRVRVKCSDYLSDLKPAS